MSTNFYAKWSDFSWQKTITFLLIVFSPSIRITTSSFFFPATFVCQKVNDDIKMDSSSFGNDSHRIYHGISISLMQNYDQNWNSSGTAQAQLNSTQHNNKRPESHKIKMLKNSRKMCHCCTADTICELGKQIIFYVFDAVVAVVVMSSVETERRAKKKLLYLIFMHMRHKERATQILQ